MEEIFEAIMTDNFPQIHVRHQTTESGNSVNTKQDNEKKRLKKKPTEAQHIQTAENQTKIPQRIQGAGAGKGVHSRWE